MENFHPVGTDSKTLTLEKRGKEREEKERRENREERKALAMASVVCASA